MNSTIIKQGQQQRSMILIMPASCQISIKSLELISQFGLRAASEAKAIYENKKGNKGDFSHPHHAALVGHIAGQTEYKAVYVVFPTHRSRELSGTKITRPGSPIGSWWICGCDRRNPTCIQLLNKASTTNQVSPLTRDIRHLSQHYKMVRDPHIKPEI